MTTATMSASSSSRHLPPPIVTSPRSGRFASGLGLGDAGGVSPTTPFGSAVHPTSSLRDPDPEASPAASRDSSDTEDEGGDGDGDVDMEDGGGDDFLAHQTSRSGRRKGRGPSSPNPEKRRKTSHSGQSPPLEPSRRVPTLAPIKPIGFAASREQRRVTEEGQGIGLGVEIREGGGGREGRALPSPVVMGFDFKQVDGDQLKTVRDTISIREQQQALIASRRREVTASTPSTPKELTFKGWQPKEGSTSGGPGGVMASGGSSGVGGRRREKTREKGDSGGGGGGLSVNTNMGGLGVGLGMGVGDSVLGSKSAPLNHQALSAQQASPREQHSGSQTAVPPHLLPSGTIHMHPDPRTAPISHSRTRNGEDGYEFSRQQGGGPLPGGGGGGGQYWRTNPGAGSGYRGYEPYGGGAGGGHSSRGSFSAAGVGAGTEHRRGYTAPGLPPPIPPPGHAHSHSHSHSHSLSHTHGAYPISSTRNSHSPPSPNANPRAPRYQPYPPTYVPAPHHHTQPGGMGMEYTLQDLLHRYEGAYASQLGAMGEFKQTAGQAGVLLGNLQKSADSLKEMVRYEVDRALQGVRGELEGLREKVRVLEGEKAGGAGKRKRDREGEGEGVGVEDAVGSGEGEASGSGGAKEGSIAVEGDEQTEEKKESKKARGKDQ